MAFNKVALLAIVLCGTLATAFAGDAGEMGGNRKMLVYGYYPPPLKNEASGGAHCGAHSYYDGAKCVALTYNKAEPYKSFSASLGVSKVGHNVAVGGAAANAHGPYTKTNTYAGSYASDHGVHAVSHGSACSGIYCP